jgi:hypothetical protein
MANGDFGGAIFPGTAAGHRFLESGAAFGCKAGQADRD